MATTLTAGRQARMASKSATRRREKETNKAPASELVSRLALETELVDEVRPLAWRTWEAHVQEREKERLVAHLEIMNNWYRQRTKNRVIELEVRLLHCNGPFEWRINLVGSFLVWAKGTDHHEFCFSSSGSACTGPRD